MVMIKLKEENMLSNLLRSLLVIFSICVSTPSWAQAFPNKPIRMVVVVAAGGPVDTIARLVADQMSLELGQQIVVENRAGAGGTVGVRSVVTSEPDGYTIMLSTLQNFGIAPAIYPDAGADADKLVPIGLAVEFPFIFVVPSQVPANTPSEFIDYARRKKGELNFGGSLATPAHLLGLLFSRSYDLDIAYVPYRGLAPSINDLLSARTHLAFDAMATLIPLIQDGKLRPLAVLSNKRSPIFPDVPTLTEVGIKNFPGNPWSGLVAPPGTPKAIIDRLNAALNASLQTPRSAELMKQLALTPIGGTPEYFKDRIAQEKPTWSELTRLSGATPQ
jgi:tripartite-type tricarboxylate transporter receptor subunit TctC